MISQDRTADQYPDLTAVQYIDSMDKMAYQQKQAAHEAQQQRVLTALRADVDAANASPETDTAPSYGERLRAALDQAERQRAQAAEPHWIAVGDAVPAPDVDVLTWRGKQAYAVGCIRVYAGGRVWNTEAPPTHWMALPAPPKGMP